MTDQQPTPQRGEPLETGWCGLYPWWHVDDDGEVVIELQEQGPRECTLTENDIRAMLAQVTQW